TRTPPSPCAANSAQKEMARGEAARPPARGRRTWSRQGLFPAGRQPAGAKVFSSARDRSYCVPAAPTPSLSSGQQEDGMKGTKSTRFHSAILALALPLLAAALTAQSPAVSKIVRNHADLPAPIGARGPQVVEVPLTAQEVVGALDPVHHIYYRYWTFNGKVPGPMIRARVGDTVAITLHNDAKDAMVHSIDVHAAMGPGGGAAMMQVPPGKTKSFAFVATIPGLYVYHCATPQSPDHIANGMFCM